MKRILCAMKSGVGSWADGDKLAGILKTGVQRWSRHSGGGSGTVDGIQARELDVRVEPHRLVLVRSVSSLGRGFAGAGKQLDETHRSLRSLATFTINAPKFSIR